MSFFDYIENLQKKPVEERKRFATTVSFVITGVIAVIWLLTLFFRFFGASDTPKPQQNVDPQSPLDALGDMFSDLI